MRLCVLGLGYIGFPTATLMAHVGHEVLGVDINEAVVERLRNGDIHIDDEPGLAKLARRVLGNGSLSVSTQPMEADVFIICVPTPLRGRRQTRVVDGYSGKVIDSPQLNAWAPGIAEAAVGRDDNGNLFSLDNESAERVGNEATHVSPLTSRTYPTVDLSYVKAAVHSILPSIRKGNLLIVESTVPPGTTESVVLPILQSHGWSRDDILLAHAPERVIPGAILREMVENDRVVGGLTPAATEAARELYASLVQGNIYTTDATTAEFVKLIENTYRDVNIALANEFAQVAEDLGIDVQQSIAMANRHPRVNILNPGPGVGGHCIPVDPYFLIERAPALTPLIQTARDVNVAMVAHVVSMVENLARENDLRRWVILGAAYKADVADDRDSPSFDIAQALIDKGFSVSIHDPYVERFSAPLDQAINGADGLLLVTDHTVYRELRPEEVGRLVAQRVVVDTRLVLDPEMWADHGFVIRRLGDGRRSMARMVS